MTSTVIICTKDRRDDLFRCLHSIQRQTAPPQQVIVVDDGSLNKDNLLATFNDLPLNYIRKKKSERGLTRSRNIGIQHATGDIVFFFDDDVVLPPDYLEKILSTYLRHPDAVGVSGLLINQPFTLGERIKSSVFMFLNLLRIRGTILFFSRNIPVVFTRSDVSVTWLCGCSSFKRSLFNKYTFDEYYYGYGLGEDFEFSSRVGKDHLLVITPTTVLYHHPSETPSTDLHTYGYMQVRNRWYYFNKHIKKTIYHKLLQYIDFIVLFIYNLLLVLFRMSKIDLLKGNLKGFKEIFSKEAKKSPFSKKVLP